MIDTSNGISRVLPKGNIMSWRVTSLRGYVQHTCNDVTETCVGVHRFSGGRVSGIWVSMFVPNKNHNVVGGSIILSHTGLSVNLFNSIVERSFE